MDGLVMVTRSDCGTKYAVAAGAIVKVFDTIKDGVSVRGISLNDGTMLYVCDEVAQICDAVERARTPAWLLPLLPQISEFVGKAIKDRE